MVTKTQQGDELSTKERIDVTLHEYDAIRKELDEDIRYLSTLGVTVSLAFLAGLWGIRDRWDRSLLPLLLPLTFPFVQWIRTGRLRNAIELGRTLARIEDRVFCLSGLVLLRHETDLVILRFNKNPWLGFRKATAWMTADLALAYCLYLYLDPALVKQFSEAWLIHRLLCISSFFVPAFLTVVAARNVAIAQVQPLVTSLRSKLERQAATDSGEQKQAE